MLESVRIENRFDAFVLMEIIEVFTFDNLQYNPETRSNGLFSDFVHTFTFMKIKIEASGWPTECDTDEKKDAYIRLCEVVDNIRIHKNAVKYNKSYRNCSKLINKIVFGVVSACPRTILRRRWSKTEKNFTNFYYHHSPLITINDIFFGNENTAYVEWRYVENAKPILPAPSKDISVITGTYTTAQARIILLSELEKLGQRLLYCDTDSVIFVASESDYIPSTGNGLGQFTNEFVEKVKMKGYVCNSVVAKKKLSFERFKNMLFDVDNDNLTTTTTSISRKKYFNIVTDKITKRFGYTFTKRVVSSELGATLPYGHIGIKNIY